MTEPAPSTPLIALRGAVLDTETTGLDATSARLVQIGVVRVVGETVDAGNRFVTLVDPGEPIPASSSAIHGIRDIDVAGAPGPARALEDLAAFLGDDAVIGHTIGFDLAILDSESKRAGKTWRPRPSLDVRRLAQVASPDLAGYGLDQLCAWLEIGIEGRHTALGDALATARVFAALVPRLRARGVRTLAEAEAACRRLDERDTATGGPAPYRVDGARRAETGAVARIDSYPYRHRVEAVMAAPPVRVPADTPLRDAIDILIDRKVSSVFVDGGDSALGIVTERDVLRCLHGRGDRALDTRLREIWSTPLQTIGGSSFVYRAIGRMERLGLRHLGVVDDSGALIGAVTTRNLLRHRASTAMILGDETGSGRDEADLAAAWAQVPMMARRLTDEEVDPRTVAAVISAEICMLTRRAAEIGEARMRDAGLGPPPVRYAVLVLGSGGRGEGLLAADQDNAIVLETGEPGGPEDRWFETLGTHIADILDRVGIPYCTGGVMARNPPWRRSVAGWTATIDDWVRRQRPEDLLNVDIFFDAAPVHGDRALADEVMRYAYRRGSGVPAFRRALSDTLGSWQSPLGLLGGFRTGTDERVDLKLNGLMPLFTAGRILSIKAGRPAHGTADRLRDAAERGDANREQIEGLITAHRVLLGTMLAQQIEDVENGVPPGPRVDPRRLDKAGRRALLDALRQVPGAVDIAREGML